MNLTNIINLFLTIRPKLLLTMALLSIVSICSIEFCLIDIKTDYSFLYKPTPVFLKLCYSFLSAFIFYFFAVHLPRERRRAKVFRYTSNRVFSINHEIFLVIYKIRDVSGIKTIDPFKLNLKDLNDACKLINPRENLFEVEIGFKDWFDYLLHKKNIIAKLMQGLMQMNDVVDSDLQEKLTLIDDIFTMRLNFEIVKPGNLDLSIFAHQFLELAEESRDMTKVFDEKYSKNYSYIYHESARKKNIARKENVK